MKWTVVVTVAAFTCACGGSNRSNTTGTASGSPSSTASQPPAAGDSRPTGTAGGTGATEMVTLIGCLQGPAAAGTAAERRADPNRPVVGTSDNDRSGTFRLVDARPASSDSGGVGANGAGGSGGPLVSGRTTFDLDAVPPAARANVNKEVRVTGRLHAREVATNGASGSTSRTLEVGQIEVVGQGCSNR